MELLRIGDKLIDRQRIAWMLDRVLEMRGRGFTQQETAKTLRVERSFISRLEKLGEVRRGRRIAVVGFPVANKQELEEVLREEGVDYWLLMNDRERWDFADKNGLQLLTELMDIMEKVRNSDIVVVMGSPFRIRFSEALLDRKVVGMELGESPIREDKVVNPQLLRNLLRELALQKGERKA